MLYNASIGSGIPSHTLIDAMVLEWESIREINRTQTAKFLDSIELETTVNNAFELALTILISATLQPTTSSMTPPRAGGRSVFPQTN